jgi:hypothetical protein
MDYSDVAAVVLARSITNQASGGVLSSIGHALTSDDTHTVGAAINASGNDAFWVMPTDRTMAKVRAGPCLQL